MTDVRIIAIGGSKGGLHALQVVLEALPPEFALPVAVVLHRQAGADDALSPILQKHCVLPVGEVEDKEPVAPGRVFVAPADYHLLVEGDHFALSTDERVLHARPSIDVLFESVAEDFGKRAAAVLLTGANEDGAWGLLQVRRRSGMTIVQDPDSAEAKTMPKAAIMAGVTSEILPLEEIGPHIAHLGTPVEKAVTR